MRATLVFFILLNVFCSVFNYGFFIFGTHDPLNLIIGTFNVFSALICLWSYNVTSY